ncbi:MAG: hypothetical protein JZD41_04375, partial [Thermoproteus sp.]|nr:hypothetical protein [Thermoproteus sp.]
CNDEREITREKLEAIINELQSVMEKIGDEVEELDDDMLKDVAYNYVAGLMGITAMLDALL